MNNSLQDARARNPLFNSNKLKLGVFGLNGSSATTTTLPERYLPTWEKAMAISQAADRAGLEANVPYARWLPFGPTGHVSGKVFDPAAFAAAVSAVTSYSSVLATVHTPVYHPMIVAKQGATIDQISAGRFGLNIVCGWVAPEIAMFGADMKAHGDRYAQADEWITILKKAWSEDESFDFNGEYLQTKQASSDPKPVQRPYPALMNAGGSDKGREFAAKHADLAFLLLTTNDLAVIKTQVDAYRQLAWDHYHRDIQVWSFANVVQRNSRQEADAYFDKAINQYGDWIQVDMFLKHQMEGAKTIPPAVMDKMRVAMAGGGGTPLFGSAEDIAVRLQQLSACGLDGMLLTWLDMAHGLSVFNRDVLPLLEQMGLRAPAPTA